MSVADIAVCATVDGRHLQILQKNVEMLAKGPLALYARRFARYGASAS
ncbi:hypothetical protein COMA1_60087 [Candidatus Nitrospira nitrosa]|uniref:Uncharacterized protein n=1 Tax=Candidatus Nitrospira nitrosa TaxID=1742972 RepID=A0A0S4LQB9_9BACT|nr:hypothetical protein COMA1_60087 [Candidatus Nitrospira nitrosa]